MFSCIRCSDLVKKLEGAGIGPRVVADCCTVENAANSAINLISEFVLKVSSSCLFHTFVIFCVSCPLLAVCWCIELAVFNVFGEFLIRYLV